MVLAYVDEIADKGGDVPSFWDDPLPMQVAKLDNALRRLR
jgi:hypothetical protein